MNDIVFNPKVISIIRDEFIKMEPHFSDMRRAAQSWGEHPDWPWNGFVLSYATLGGSLNWEKRVGPQYDELYGWSVLNRLTLDERRKRLKKFPILVLLSVFQSGFSVATKGSLEKVVRRLCGRHIYLKRPPKHVLPMYNLTRALGRNMAEIFQWTVTMNW